MVKKILLFILLVLLGTQSVQAQYDPYEGPPIGGCNPDEFPEGCDEPDETPLDDGVTYLLIAGVIFGVTRLSKNLKIQLAEDRLS